MQDITSARHKIFLKTCTEQRVKQEIEFWTDRFIDDEWEKVPIKVLVIKYWIKGDDHAWIERIQDEQGFDWDKREKEIIESDLFDGIHYESEYFVWFILDQVGYKCKMKLDCEKVLATITTADVVKLVLKHRGLI